MCQKSPGLSVIVSTRRFYSLFGVSTAVTALAWALVPPSMHDTPGPKYLLWGPIRLKTYVTDTVCANIAACDEKTFVKWAWIVIMSIAKLQVVRKFISI